MAERRLTGLALKVGPLGEHDRLLSLLSDAEGVSRFAVPGARRPKSSLAAAAPLTLLELQVGGRSGLARVRQLRVLRSFSGLGQQLETLAAAQALCDLCLQLAAQDPVDGLLDTMQLHLERLEEHRADPELVLAGTVQACIHLLTLAAMDCRCRPAASRAIPSSHRLASGTGAAAFCRRTALRSMSSPGRRFS